jgi:hypothetical protein
MQFARPLTTQVLVFSPVTRKSIQVIRVDFIKPSAQNLLAQRCYRKPVRSGAGQQVSLEQMRPGRLYRLMKKGLIVVRQALISFRVRQFKMVCQCVLDLVDCQLRLVLQAFQHGQHSRLKVRNHGCVCLTFKVLYFFDARCSLLIQHTQIRTSQFPLLQIKISILKS